MGNYNGLNSSLGNLWKLTNARTRSISPENPTGEKGKGGMAVEGVAHEQARGLGQGWKVSPYVSIAPQQTYTLADIRESGAIQQIWMTPEGICRFMIVRIYWDEQEHPSVECPLGDFFACGWDEYAQVSSLAICVNPRNGFNCYWEMPFRKRCRITVTNIDADPIKLFYQINYTLTDVPGNAAYFHAQFRRVNPLPYKEIYTILDGINGKGNYVGTYMAWGVNNSGWWGEGEMKFYIDGDEDFPTICGTGTEDYVGGAWCFENNEATGYQEFSTPYSGLPQIIRPDGFYKSQQRFGLYRWHITDPIHFEQDIRATVQALGWRKGQKTPYRRYLPLQDDISSVAYWYQSLPTAPFPGLPTKDYLEIV